MFCTAEDCKKLNAQEEPETPAVGSDHTAHETWHVWSFSPLLSLEF